MVTISNKEVIAEFVNHGAEMVSLRDAKNGKEYIWQADPAYWNRHTPVLFPFVGKVNGGHYRYNGKTYDMGQHGFARDMDFAMTHANGNSVVFRLRDTEETREKYPFAFVLDVGYQLEGRKVIVSWCVQNPSGTKDLYYSIGGHPAFNVPELRADGTPEADKAEYRISFPGKDFLKYMLIDPETSGVDTRAITLNLENGSVQATEALFKKDALIFDAEQVKEARILRPDGSSYIIMKCDGFASFGLWSKPGSNAPFICLEPWMGRCDAMDFTGELPEKEMIRKLGPGKQEIFQYSMEFC